MEYFWPDGLPSVPLLDDFLTGTANNTVRTSMECGPAKIRRRTSSSMRSLTCSYLLRSDAASGSASCISGTSTSASGTTEKVDQVSLFYDFMETVEGLSFWLPDPLDPSRYLKVRIKPQSEDTGVETTPKSATIWTVTLSFEVWPHAVRSRA